MNTLEAVRQRKSIRKFQNKTVPEEMITEILTAGMEAPSVKNSQHWKFYVLRGEAREQLAKLMAAALDYFRDAGPAGSPPMYGSLAYSIDVIRSAPAVILVFNTGNHTLNSEDTLEARFMDCGVLEGIGAAIQNMLLAATDLGLGSLWICDVFFAYELICDWLGESSQLAAGIALGYSDDHCKKAARHDLAGHVVYLGEPDAVSHK